MVSKVLDKQGASMRCRGLFYKAVVQSVLLYGCETWVVKEGMLKVFQGGIPPQGCKADNWEDRKAAPKWRAEAPLSRRLFYGRLGCGACGRTFNGGRLKW